MYFNSLKLFIPNLFTLSSFMLGFFSIIFSFYAAFESNYDYYFYSSLFIFIAAFFDSMDGFFARKVNVSGEFGSVLDSLSDLVSFGVAPAIMFYTMFFISNSFYYSALFPYSLLGAFIAFLFPLSGIIRLAKFHTLDHSSGFFVGMPIPIAGISIVLFLQFDRLPDFFSVLTILDLNTLPSMHWGFILATFLFYVSLMNLPLIFFKKKPFFFNISASNNFWYNASNLFIIFLFLIFFKLALLVYLIYYSFLPILTYKNHGDKAVKLF